MVHKAKEFSGGWAVLTSVFVFYFQIVGNTEIVHPYCPLFRSCRVEPEALLSINFLSVDIKL